MNIEEHPYYKEDINKLKDIISHLQSKYFGRIADTLTIEQVKHEFDYFVKEYRINYKKIYPHSFRYDYQTRNFMCSVDILPIRNTIELNFNPFTDSYFARR